MKQVLKHHPANNATQALDKIFKSIDETTDPKDIERGDQFVGIFETAQNEYDAYQQAKRNIVNQFYSKRLRILTCS